MKSLLTQKIQENIPEVLPIIPTMDVVVFPHMIVPLLVLDEKILQGINKTLEESKMVFLLAAKKQIDQDGVIGTNDLYTVGTVANIMRLIKLPEGGVKILVQGVCKARCINIITQDSTLHAHVECLEHLTVADPDMVNAHVKNIKALAEQMAQTGQSFSPDFHIILSKMQDAEKIADFILTHLNLSVHDAQDLLTKDDLADFLATIYHHLHQEIESSELQEKIRNHARESMNRSQKEYYLREQLKAIKKELGDDDLQEIEQMHEKLETLIAPEEVKSEIKRQINRLERTSPDSMEAAVTRNHLEWIFAMPWNIETTDNLDISRAQEILDGDHYGLKDIKDRILDYLSVRKLNEDGYPPILCFVGPPGTGKTSLGTSIAKSLERHYARISLGGVKDEAEIRGHRRTYVGAMPGRFIQALRKAGSSNPVVVIDELDKIGADFRGDPSAAMLEVLDPHQNKAFYDNYLGVPFDLSKIMFIATANTIDTISEPLRDRMEIIELSGYTVQEKLAIARKHLITKSITETGLHQHPFDIHDLVIEDLVHHYTKESGVRQLERTIRKLCSKAARAFVERQELVNFSQENIEQFLGPRRCFGDTVSCENQVGITHGLAWTAYGGELLNIEAVLMPGTGKLLLTGQLGEVMKESAQAALSYARAHAQQFNIPNDTFTKFDLHIHVPAGAVPKDGPSAGITMLTSILSALTQCPIDGQCAMTGEINLRGEVMPIGGVKEKILAAKRHNIGRVILPFKNKPDISTLDSEVLAGIDLIWVNHADEVIAHALVPDTKH